VTKHPQIWGRTVRRDFQNFDKFFCDKTSPMPIMQNSLVYTMISPVVVVTIYIADKKKKLYVTKHPPDAAAIAAAIAAAANHAKFIDFTKICQPTNTLIRILVRLRLCKYASLAAQGRATMAQAASGRAAPAAWSHRRRIENVEK
jgi:hypothetical protein